MNDGQNTPEERTAAAELAEARAEIDRLKTIIAESNRAAEDAAEAARLAAEDLAKAEAERQAAAEAEAARLAEEEEERLRQLKAERAAAGARRKPGEPGPFPAGFLRLGDRARRQSWAPGYELIVGDAGGRSGAKLALMTTGSRAGLIEWKPQHLADELLAQDWEVLPA